MVSLFSFSLADEDGNSIFLDCPSVLAKHFSHLFLRDPLYVTDQQVEDKDPNKLYAFEVSSLVFFLF